MLNKDDEKKLKKQLPKGRADGVQSTLFYSFREIW